jgi:hypothetical protein
LRGGWRRYQGHWRRRCKPWQREWAPGTHSESTNTTLKRWVSGRWSTRQRWPWRWRAWRLRGGWRRYRDCARGWTTRTQKQLQFTQDEHTYVHPFTNQEDADQFFYNHQNKIIYNMKVVSNGVVKLLAIGNFKCQTVCNKFDKIRSKRFQIWTWNWRFTPNETRNL